jgi:hypothetical protein
MTDPKRQRPATSPHPLMAAVGAREDFSDVRVSALASFCCKGLRQGPVHHVALMAVRSPTNSGAFDGPMFVNGR